MAGEIKKMIDKIYYQRANGNEMVVGALNTKLILKGIYPNAYNETSPDDETTINKIKLIAVEMGVKV